MKKRTNYLVIILIKNNIPETTAITAAIFLLFSIVLFL